MKIILTDKQIVCLGWDDPGIPSPKAIRRTSRGTEFELTEEQLEEAIDTAESLSWGSDCTSTAKSILKKLSPVD